MLTTVFEILHIVQTVVLFGFVAASPALLIVALVQMEEDWAEEGEEL